MLSVFSVVKMELHYELRDSRLLHLHQTALTHPELFYIFHILRVFRAFRVKHPALHLYPSPRYTWPS